MKSGCTVAGCRLQTQQGKKRLLLHLVIFRNYLLIKYQMEEKKRKNLIEANVFRLHSIIFTLIELHRLLLKSTSRYLPTALSSRLFLLKSSEGQQILNLSKFITTGFSDTFSVKRLNQAPRYRISSLLLYLPYRILKKINKVKLIRFQELPLTQNH